MREQPDRLFREKLHGYEQTVPADAWNRVSANLNKNRYRFRLRIAASVLALTCAGIALYSLVTDSSRGQVAQNQTAPAAETSEPPISAPLENGVQDAVTPAPETTAEIQPRDYAKKPVTSHRARKITSPPPKESAPALPEATSEVAVTTEDIAENEKEDEVVPADPLETGRKNITIVFTAEEVNEKYLAKNSEVEATPDQKESSGIRKLLDKAYDLKNSQDLLGDLRQKKNEILAMNFKNEKQRTEND